MEILTARLAVLSIGHLKLSQADCAITRDVLAYGLEAVLEEGSPRTEDLRVQRTCGCRLEGVERCRRIL